MATILPNPTRSPEPAEVIRNAIDDALRDCHVSNPGLVLSYDSGKQLAKIQPLLMRTFINDDGTVDVETPPVLNNVPVVWPSGGGFRLTFPLGAGDTVGIIYADQSLDIWKAQGGGPLDPIDQRLHSLSDAWAIPRLRGNAPWTSVSGSHVQIGQDGANEAMAAIIGSLVIANTTMATWISAVTTYINGVAPGTLTPPTDFGKVTTGSNSLGILG